MRVDFQFAESEHKKFKNACEVAISRVGNSSQTAVMEAAQEIMMESMSQVPKDTGTLARSAFIGVSRVDKLKSYRYGAVLGYGTYAGIGDTSYLNGIEWIWEPTNPVHPKHGFRASAYAGRVHEDLTQPHRNGKAKFLEDPVRDWSSGKFARVAYKYWKQAIESVDYYQDTSSSMSDINRLIKQGKVIMPDLEDALNKLNESKNQLIDNSTKANHLSYKNALANYAKASAATDTYRLALGNTNKKSYNAYSRGGFKVRSKSTFHTVLMRRQDVKFVDVTKDRKKR